MCRPMWRCMVTEAIRSRMVWVITGVLALLVLLALTCVVVFIFSSHWAEISTALAQLSFWQVLLVLAIGAGSVFFSHLNDAGFWLVKEYFGMSVGQTLKTWSLMETILSVVGLGCVMLLSLVL